MSFRVAFAVRLLLLFINTGCCILFVTGQKRTLASKPVKKTPPVLVSPDYEILNCRRWETAAEYPTCDTGWSHYLTKTVDADLSKRNGASPGVYQVEVWFVVRKDGSIEIVMPITHYGFGMEEELIRAIQQSPNWRPATYNGRKVSYRVKQTFRFVVSEPLLT